MSEMASAIRSGSYRLLASAEWPMCYLLRRRQQVAFREPVSEAQLEVVESLRRSTCQLPLCLQPDIGIILQR